MSFKSYRCIRTLQEIWVLVAIHGSTNSLTATKGDKIESQFYCSTKFTLRTKLIKEKRKNQFRCWNVLFGGKNTYRNFIFAPEKQKLFFFLNHFLFTNKKKKLFHSLHLIRCSLRIDNWRKTNGLALFKDEFPNPDPS